MIRAFLAFAAFLSLAAVASAEKMKLVVAYAPTASDHDLGRRWQQDGDLEAGRELLRRARGTPSDSFAVMELSGAEYHHPEAVGALLPELERLAKDVGNGPDIEARKWGGSLMRDVYDWKNRWSPAALANRRSLRRQEMFESVTLFVLVLGMPLTAFLAGIWVTWTRSILIWLLIGRSSALSRAFGDAGTVVEREHRSALLLPAAAVVASAVLGVTVWQAVSLVGPATRPEEMLVLAWRAILTARVLVAYFCAGFAFYFMHAMFLSMMIAVARGRKPDFAAAFRGAAARWRSILVLSGAVFAGLLLIEAGLNALSGRRWATRYLAAARFGAWLAETGFTIGSVLALAVSIGDDVELEEAAIRAGRLLAARARPAIVSILGVEALEGDIVGTWPVAGFFFGMTGMPVVWSLIGPDVSLAQTLRLPLWFTDAHLFIFGGLALGVLMGGFMYSGLLALESIFAAGLYSYGKDDVVRGPMIARLKELVPDVSGALSS